MSGRISAADPDPNPDPPVPHFLGPPGSGSITVKISVADLDPHHFGKLVQDPEQHFGEFEGQNLEKSEW